MDFRRKITDAMERGHWSQAGLARAAGVSQGRISDYLAGGDMQSSSLEKIFRALGLSVKQTKRTTYTARPAGRPSSSTSD